MSKNPIFSKTPLTPEEKAEKEKQFLSFSKIGEDKPSISPSENKSRKEKEVNKAFLIRAPKSYWSDIQEIVNYTGLSMNAVCLELLRPAIKKKLKELKDE